MVRHDEDDNDKMLEIKLHKVISIKRRDRLGEHDGALS
jgi:hypothetical protein